MLDLVLLKVVDRGSTVLAVYNCVSKLIFIDSTNMFI